MLKIWMRKWMVSLCLTELDQPAASVSRTATPVPDWQVPAYLRRRTSGDRLRV